MTRHSQAAVAGWLTHATPTLRELTLSHIGLTAFKIPPCLRQLIHLDLEGNLLKRVPANLEALSGLTYLSLACQGSASDSDVHPFRIDRPLTDWPLILLDLQVLDLSQEFGFEWDAESLFALAALETAFKTAGHVRKGSELEFYWHTSSSQPV